MGNEKLATVGVGSGVGHGQFTGYIVAQAVVGFAFELVAGATGTGALWAAALNHEIGDYTVEAESIVVSALNEVYETGYGHGGFSGKQVDVDVPFAGAHGYFKIGHGCSFGLNGYRSRMGVKPFR